MLPTNLLKTIDKDRVKELLLSQQSVWVYYLVEEHSKVQLICRHRDNIDEVILKFSDYDMYENPTHSHPRFIKKIEKTS